MELNLSYTKPQVEIFFNSTQKYVIVPKGRRFGATKGGANACIEWCVEGKKILWGDTINSNIDRYFERYFQPELKKNKIPYRWQSQQKQLKIFDGFVDFRSADNPENWEGFAYDKIFLNEAGIILEDTYLYTNAVLPMLIDYADSQLFAIGVPKGKLLKKGGEHPFYKLAKRAQEGHPQYRLLEFTSYDNPLLTKEDIDALRDEIAVMSPSQERQEIYGEFIDGVAGNRFAHKFNPDKHISERAIHRPAQQILISLDFNIQPFCASFSHIWEDAEGQHCHVFDEIEVPNGNIPVMAEIIKEKYGKWLYNCLLTGDKGGDRGDMSQRDLASHYIQLKRALNLSDNQIKTPANPKHKNSRADVNYTLTYMDDLVINPKCKGLIYDLKMVEVDEFEKILKSNRDKSSQRADHLDTFRYLVNTFLFRWLERHQKSNKF